jgi:hypothetical protein
MDMLEAEKDKHHFRGFKENITGHYIKAEVNPNTPTPHPTVREATPWRVGNTLSFG